MQSTDNKNVTNIERGRRGVDTAVDALTPPILAILAKRKQQRKLEQNAQNSPDRAAEPLSLAPESQANQDDPLRSDAAPCGKCGNCIFWKDPRGFHHCAACEQPRVPAMARSRSVVIDTPEGRRWEHIAGSEAPRADPEPKPRYGPPAGISFDAWWDSLPDLTDDAAGTVTQPAKPKCPRCGRQDFDQDPRTLVRWCIYCYPPSSRFTKKPKPRLSRRK